MPAASIRSSLFGGDSYTACTASSMNETMDGLVGPGRTLGLLYGLIGERLENVMGRAAEKILHRGPRETAESIKSICGIVHFSGDFANSRSEILQPENPSSIKRIQNKCKRLRRYVLSDVPSTRFQTLNQIIELSVYNDSVRKLLKEEVLAAINALRLNPTEWCHMSESLQISARRALIALEDNNISSIMREYQRDSCENNSRLAYALWRFLFNKDYSFLVLRHFSKNYDRWMYGYIADFATKISQLGFEDYVEWPELDTILSQIPINAGRVNCIFRYSQKLPKSADMAKRGLEDKCGRLISSRDVRILDTDCIDDLAEALTSLQKIGTEMHCESNFSNVVCTHPSLNSIHEKILNPSDRALGVICSSDYRAMTINDQVRQDGYLQLAAFVDSDDKALRSRAEYGIGIVLCLSRYSRLEMLRALATTNFSLTEEYEKLERSSSRGPLTLGRNKNQYTFYRHRKDDGEVLHVMFFEECGGECGGECGATVEEALSIDSDLILELKVTPDDTFSCEAHLPLIAGQDYSGESVYMASLIEQGQQSTQMGFYNGQAITITDGTKQKDLILESHNSYGFIDVISVSEGFELRVPVLRYEASACLPNGPGSPDWVFSRQLSTSRKNGRWNSSYIWKQAFNYRPHTSSDDEDAIFLIEDDETISTYSPPPPPYSRTPGVI